MNQSSTDGLAVDTLGLLVGGMGSSSTSYVAHHPENFIAGIRIWEGGTKSNLPEVFSARYIPALREVLAESGGPNPPDESIDRMQHLVELLVRLNLQTDGHVGALLEDLVDQLNTPRSNTARLLPAAEVEALKASGSFVEQLPDPAERGSTQTVVLRQRLRRDALPMAEVRRILGVSDSRIRQRISKRTLHALTDVGQGRRFPAYQFAEDAELPKWSVVAPAFPADVDLISVEQVMSSPHSDLPIDGKPVSPREWLLAEQPADKVVELAHQAYEIP